MDSKTRMKFNVLAIICIIIFSCAIAPKTLQNDTYYTISIGEHIVEHGIDKIDPFSWSDLKYTYPHWLYDVSIYLIYNVGGMTGIYISTVVLSCILGIVLYVTNNKINKNQLFSFCLTIGVMFLLRDFIAARAQLVTFILFVLEILFIECFLETKKKRYALFLMIIAGLIANLHAAVFYVFFVLMLPYFGEYAVILLRDSRFWYKIQIYCIKKKIERMTKREASVDKIETMQERLSKAKKAMEKFGENSKKREQNPYRIKIIKREAVKWLLLVAILCFAMGLLTPIGDEPYTHIFKLLSGNTTKSISEHQPLVLSEHTGAIIVVGILVIFLVLTDTKISLKDAFMLGGLLILTFTSRRQFSLLLVVGVMSITKLMTDFIEKYDKGGTEQFVKLMTNWKGKVLTIIFIVILSSYFYRYIKKNEYVDSSSYPIEAANYILNEVQNGRLNFENMKLYNDYNYGSYLLYRGIPVFIDSRADLYSPEFNPDVNIFSDYMNISSISTYYDTKFEEYGITHVITYKKSKLNMLISRDDKYNSIYVDDNFVIYERLGNSIDNGN